MVKVPKNFPPYMEAYHLWLKDNKGKSFNLAFMDQHWAEFQEYMEANEKPPKKAKPSKTRALKGLETALKKCGEVVDFQSDDNEKKAIAAEMVATQKALNASMNRMADPNVLGERLIAEGVMACSRGANAAPHALHAAATDNGDNDDDDSAVGNHNNNNAANPAMVEAAKHAAAAKQVAATMKKVLPPPVMKILKKRSHSSVSSNSDGDANADGDSEGGDVVVHTRKKIRTAMTKCTEVLAKAPVTDRDVMTAGYGDEIVATAPADVLAYLRARNFVAALATAENAIADDGNDEAGDSGASSQGGDEDEDFADLDDGVEDAGDATSSPVEQDSEA